ncbi:MAG: N-acetylmuramoyl-L-alanine amidase [Alphaproteobacteria bacterium]|nr:N-acetylmuramoyl-L-alanine amidase [Alphaproteobacteria bacterium]
MEIIKRPLPHFSDRNSYIDMIVLHCSRQSSDEMARLLDELNLSSHYIIGYNGEIIQTVEEEKKAFHAGISFWNEKENINDRSIGIELSNETLGQSAYGKKQIESLVLLLKDIIERHKIKPQNIVAHSDIAPLRKPDPNLCFPWEELAEKSISLWYDLDDSDKIDSNDADELLEIIGYDTRDEERKIASAYAFRRRFLPQEVELDEDVMHLVDNVYPVGKKELLTGELFFKTLRAVAYRFSLTK